MASVALEKLSRDIEEIKVTLHKLVHIVGEDFELSETIKKELEESRSEPLSEYIDHDKVLKEFS